MRKRNWHSIIGPNGMCECGVKADGLTVVSCGALLASEKLAQGADPTAVVPPDAPVVLPVVARLREHGKTCSKVLHVGGGYLHAMDDDRPYDVDGVLYCGRCHRELAVVDAVLAACPGEKVEITQFTITCPYCYGLHALKPEQVEAIRAALTLSEGTRTNDDEGKAAPSGPRQTE